MTYKISFFALFLLISELSAVKPSQWFLPINTKDRTNFTELKLSSIGQFGLQRKARETVPAHLHTGIDICRPNNNYKNEKIFPACKGMVISIRDDGPFAQIIIEHRFTNECVWTVYEHIAEISCHIGDSVSPQIPIARFFSRPELNRFGWQFDHFHFEVLKQKPTEIIPSRLLPNRRFNTFALTCYTLIELHDKYYDPVEFLTTRLHTRM